jgi:hypothetical protein
MPTTTRKNALRLRDVSGPEIGPRVPNCSAPPPSYGRPIRDAFLLQMLKNSEWQARRIRGIGLDGRTEMGGVGCCQTHQQQLADEFGGEGVAKQTWFGASQRLKSGDTQHGS